MANKVVFLDIDGVVCLYPEWQQNWEGNQNDRLDEYCCKNLKAVLDVTDAKIVITSSWRLTKMYLSDLYNQFERFGITNDYIVGQTADLRRSDNNIKSHNQLRWVEIEDYVDKHSVEKYIILDDFNLEEYDKERFVRTKMHSGLTAHLKDVCINKLML